MFEVILMGIVLSTLLLIILLLVYRPRSRSMNTSLDPVPRED